jgi:hypothetical protein
MTVRPSQVDRKIVGHDSLISYCSEDGGGVDLQEFGGVNRSIVLLQQMGLELARPDHHLEMWCKRHTPPRACWRVRGTHNKRRRHLSCWRKRFKISLEVTALAVVALLMVAFDGDATILSHAMADELITEVDRCDACSTHI